jgi:hypothetical protein
MHDAIDLQETMLPYMDVTTKSLLAVGDQVVAVVQFVIRVLKDG